MAAFAARVVSSVSPLSLLSSSHRHASPDVSKLSRRPSLQIGFSDGGCRRVGRRNFAIVALAASPDAVSAIVENASSVITAGAASSPLVSAVDWANDLFLASLNTAATLASDGPIELPPVSGVPAYLEDPWAIPEVSPIQSFASLILTGTIGVLLFRALKRRAQKVTDSRFRSDSVEKLSPGPAADERKEKAAKAAAEAAKRPPPTVLNTLGGALMAATIAIVLYRFASSVDDNFANQTLSTTYTVRNISVAVRTIVSGLVWLATFIFAANSIGLTLYAFQLALGIDSDKDRSSSVSETSISEGTSSELKEADLSAGNEEKKPAGFGASPKETDSASKK